MREIIIDEWIDCVCFESNIWVSQYNIQYLKKITLKIK